ncbi:MAG: hypothetical protein ACREEL_00085 [Stellaceae bacterium]
MLLITSPAAMIVGEAFSDRASPAFYSLQSRARGQGSVNVARSARRPAFHFSTRSER